MNLRGLGFSWVIILSSKAFKPAETINVGESFMQAWMTSSSRLVMVVEVHAFIELELWTVL